MDRSPHPHLRSGPSQEFLQPPRRPPKKLRCYLLWVPVPFSSACRAVSSTEQVPMNKR